MEVTRWEEDGKGALTAGAAASGLLAQHHPVWMGIFRGMGEDCRGLVAREDSRVRGWLFYSVFPGPFGTIINSIPLIGYGGPTLFDADPAVADALLKALRAEAVEMGADVLTVSTSPFLSPELEDTYRRALGVTHELENFVQLSPLGIHPLDQLSGGRRSSIRRQINRAARHGLRVTVHLAPENFGEWLSMYRARCEEIGAPAYPEDFYRRAYELGVPSKAVEFWGIFQEELLIGGVMFLVSEFAVDYFTPVCLGRYRNLFPITFLLNRAFSEFSSRRIKYFNWQSSPDRGGVYQYKARWGAREGRHFYMSVLLRRETRILHESISRIREEYPLRFILPYSAWASGQEKTREGKNGGSGSRLV